MGEAEFLARLAASPDDLETRLVYADWLEERGEPKRWDALAPTEDPRARHCAACERRVHYCSSLDDVRTHGQNGACVAFDASLVREQALTAYDGDDILMGELA